MMFSRLKEITPFQWRILFYQYKYKILPPEMRITKPFSQKSLIGFLLLQELCLRCDELKIKGDIVELGTYKGGSGALLAYYAAHSRLERKMWIYDSFQGMPSLTPGKDLEETQGQNVGSEENLRRLIRALGLTEEKVLISRGWFTDTFKKDIPDQVSLLHVDCDYYASVKLSLETFYDRIVPNGYIILDDFGHFEGCRVAFNEFWDNLKIKPTLIQLDRDIYYFQKPEQLAVS